jgi:tRNA modification GTPase
MDLAQAESVADLIGAESLVAAKAAVARLDGAAGRALREMRAALLSRLVEIEAHVDYPDEVPPPDADAIAAVIESQRARIAALLAGAGAAKALRDGIDCVIAGPPNAGKSSLLNALLDAERAIVSDIPGTTRDIVEDRVAVDGVVLRLRDTAGLRATTDVIEAEGVARARAAVEGAEIVMLVIDGSMPLGKDERIALDVTDGRPRIVIANKADLGDAGVRQLLREAPAIGDSGATSAFVSGSVLDAATIAAIRGSIARLGWGGGAIDANSALIGSARQIEALVRAGEALDHAAATISARHPVDLLSGDLAAAIAAYGEVTGETVTSLVLEGIFSRFCVGK